MNRYIKIYRFAMSIAIIGLIGSMVLLNILTKDRDFSDLENRRLQEKPQFSVKDILAGKYTSDYEKYVADQFPLRDFFVHVKSFSERALGKRENNGIYIGKDGYLFQGIVQPTEKELDEKIEAVNSFAESLKGANVYLMIAPTANEVLKSKLPPYSPIYKEELDITKLKNKLDKGIKYIDVTDTLKTYKSQYIYYKTDHHWTTKGAYYAYRCFADSVGITAKDDNYFNIKLVTSNFYGSLYSKGGFADIKPDSIELYLPKKAEELRIENFDNNQVSNSLYVMDNINKKDKYTVFLGGNYSLLKISSNAQENKKVLIVKDSYANSFIPFLTSHYNEIYVVDLRYYSDSLKEMVKMNKISDVLILYNEKSFLEDSNILYISY